MSDTNIPRAASGDLQIKQGSTFWDWVLGDHSILKKGLVFVLFVVAAFIMYRWNPRYCVVLIVSFIVGFVIFSKVLITEGAVRVIALDPDYPTQISIKLIGSRRFAEMSKDQSPLAFSCDDGSPIYIAEKLDLENNSIVYAWTHETSRWRFLTQSDAYEKLREIAEVNTRELMRIRHIPRSIAMVEAGRIIRHYDSTIERILAGEVSVEELEREITDGRDIIAEMEATE